MAHAEHEKADNGEAKAENLDAAHGIDAVQGNIDDARNVAREQRDGNRDVKQDICQRCRMGFRECAQQQIEGKGDEEVGNFIADMNMHMTTS